MLHKTTLPSRDIMITNQAIQALHGLGEYLQTNGFVTERNAITAFLVTEATSPFPASTELSASAAAVERARSNVLWQIAWEIDVLAQARKAAMGVNSILWRGSAQETFFRELSDSLKYIALVTTNFS